MDSETKKKAFAFCTGCAKFNTNPSTGKQPIRCEAFTEFFFLWGSGRCWAREEDEDRWERDKQKMDLYYKVKNGNMTLEQAQKATNRLDITSKEIRKLFWEESDGKYVKKRGGGEKSEEDPGMKQRVKDNRTQWRWDEL